MIRIKLISIMVDDQAKALKFYTEKVGFTVKEDIPMGEFRWLTVGNSDDDLELVLEPNQLPSAQAFQKDLFEKGIPATALLVDDIDAEYQRLCKNDVKFKSEPQDMGGVMVASFDDTCGNYIQLYQQ